MFKNVRNVLLLSACCTWEVWLVYDVVSVEIGVSYSILA